MKYVTSILCLLAHSASAEQQSEVASKSKLAELDVTMQIIVDPAAKLPDAVVRRIPLPQRKSAPSQAPTPTAPSTGDKGNKEGAREVTRQLRLEVGQSARERSKEATEQRELARRRRAT